MDCKKCRKDFDYTDFPFGDPLECPHCGALNTTDWDYTDCMEGSMTAWTTGIVETPPSEVPSK